MSNPLPLRSLEPARRRRLTLLALARSVATSLGLLALYFVAPLRQLGQVPVALSLSIELVVLVVVVAWQIRSITRADYPGIRAIEALSVTTPLFLLLFAVAYFLLSHDDPANFSPGVVLSRTDTLYFTVTTFSTVGFGDITATSQGCRLIVTTQMLLDVLVLGLGIRLVIGAVQIGQRRHSDTTTDLPS